MKQITLYSTPFCTYCLRAKALLVQEQLPFSEVDLSLDDSLREQLVEKYAWQTVPMIMIGEEFIGGYDQLAALHKSDQLLAKIKGE